MPITPGDIERGMTSCFLVLCLILNIVTSFSLPLIPVLSHVNVDFNDQTQGVMVQNSIKYENLKTIRFGIWAPCFSNSQGVSRCLNPKFVYSVMIGISDPKLPEQPEVTTQVSTLRPYSLAFHPFLAFMQFLFLVLNLKFFRILRDERCKWVLSLFALISTTIVAAMDYFFFTHVQSELGGIREITISQGPALYASLIPVIFLWLFALLWTMFSPDKKIDGRLQPRKDDVLVFRPLTDEQVREAGCKLRECIA